MGNYQSMSNDDDDDNVLQDFWSRAQNCGVTYIVERRIIEERS
jgi:hypothetical protein